MPPHVQLRVAAVLLLAAGAFLLVNGTLTVLRAAGTV